MSTSQEVNNLATRVATEIKAVRVKFTGNNGGDLSTLSTTAKGNFIAAINEVLGIAQTAASSGITPSAVDAKITAALDAFVSAAPGALNSLQELAAAIGNDPNFATTLATSIASKADDSAVVKLTGAQTIAGAKTFTSTVVVPDGTLTQAQVSGLVAALAAKAASTATVNLTGSQTIAGVKTFSSAPAVPDASFLIAKVSGLQTALDAKALASAIVDLTNNQTVGGVKTFTLAPVVPANAFGVDRISGLQTLLDAKALATAVVDLTTNQTVGGVKTFTLAPVVPSASFPIAAVSGLQAQLDSLAGQGGGGGIEATNTEIANGTVTGKYVSPAGLRSALGDPATSFVATFEAGLV